jgi:hypothetical protein
MMPNVNGIGSRVHLPIIYIIDRPRRLLLPYPGGNGYRATRELSRGNKLPHGFRDKSRFQEVLQENTLQVR